MTILPIQLNGAISSSITVISVPSSSIIGLPLLRIRLTLTIANAILVMIIKAPMIKTPNRKSIQGLSPAISVSAVGSIAPSPASNVMSGYATVRYLVKCIIGRIKEETAVAIKTTLLTACKVSRLKRSR